jgi:sulfane dehydrogenase subunit SoxC
MADRTGAALAPVAGGGLLDRRVLLRRGLVFATAAPAALAARAADAPDDAPPDPPSMRVAGGPFTAYGQPSPHERQVLRRISANRMLPGNGVALTPLEDLEGMLTPSGLHFERHHNGVPDIDPARHELLIHGRVGKPLKWTVADLLRYPMRSQLNFIECGGNSNAGWHPEPIQRPVGSFNGLVSCAEWTGVPLRVLLDEAGVARDGTWAVAEGADAFAMNVSLPMAKLRDDTLLALYQNGERLRPEHGYPMRLVVPGWEGVVHVKWLHRLEVTDRPVMARNETAKYSELQPDGRTRQFTFVMDVKSLITAPTHGRRLAGPGLHQISGLAWSGHGRVRRVDVSADGGRTWAQAALDGPVLPRCLTRFRMPWRWDGQPLVLKSRATDDTGRVQPERAALLAERGANGYYHFNGILAWAVEADGEVRHVYA